MSVRAHHDRLHKYEQALGEHGDAVNRELDDDRRFFEEHPQRRIRLRYVTVDELLMVAELGWSLPPDPFCAFTLVVALSDTARSRQVIGLDCQLWSDVIEKYDRCDRDDVALRAIVATAPPAKELVVNLWGQP